MNTITRWLVAVFIGAFAWVSPLAMAQENSHTTEKQPSKGVLALKTNLLEWTAAIPNFSVMTDLSGKPWNRSVFALSLKYKWKTSEAYVPSYMLTLLEIRPEYRYYLNNKFYVGGYGAYSDFSTKLPKNPTGWTGFSAGGGASAGMELPLYQYRKSALDIELGFSLGAHYALYRDFTTNEDQTGIEISDTRSGRILPYPELRVALVWRKTSVKDKYNSTNPMKAIYAQEKEAIQINMDATNKETFDAMQQGKLKFNQDDVFQDLYQGDLEAYRADYEAYLQESFVDMALDNVERSRLDERSKEKLRKWVERLRKKAMAEFDKSINPKNKK
jgi:hypothetical protein